MSELLEKILSKDNMNTAYKRVCSNKGAGGVDGVSVEELGDYIKENWDSIKNQIRSREYKPQPVRRVEIPKPNGGMRKLGTNVLMQQVKAAVRKAENDPPTIGFYHVDEIKLIRSKKKRKQNPEGEKHHEE